MASPAFTPVMEPYDIRVVTLYLAQAFNGNVAEVDPTRSPLWPIAQRMVAAMHRDRYQLGAYTSSTLAAERPHVGGAPPERQVRPATRAVAVHPRSSYGHAVGLAQAGG